MGFRARIEVYSSSLIGYVSVNKAMANYRMSVLAENIDPTTQYFCHISTNGAVGNCRTAKAADNTATNKLEAIRDCKTIDTRQWSFATNERDDSSCLLAIENGDFWAMS